MRVEARAATLGKLRSADLALAAGRYVALGIEPEPLAALVALLAGEQPARAGRVRLDGSDPFRSPEARRQIAALLDEESLPPAKNVLESLKKALRARGTLSATAEQLLRSMELERLGPLALRALERRELRSVALALALSHDSANLFVLHEPLTTLLPAALVLERLERHTSRGAVVFCTTSSPADAAALGGRCLCVELGRVRDVDDRNLRLGEGPWQQVLVETTDAPALSQALHQSGHGLTTEVGASTHSLKVTGPALDVTVGEIARIARASGIELLRIEAATPPVEALMAARAGFARGAYEASRAAALGAVPGPAPQPPGPLPPPPTSNTPALP